MTYAAGSERSVDEVAIIVNPMDNVATARVPLASGEFLIQGTRTIEIRDGIPFGHKFALTDIREGESAIKFGDPIGRTTRDIAPGEWVHIHNLESRRGKGGVPVARNAVPLRAAPPQHERAPGADASRVPERGAIDRHMTFLGYRRSDGSAGVRNHLVVLPSVNCATRVAELIAEGLGHTAGTGAAVAIPNQHGCSQLGVDRDQTFRTLVGTGANPNVGAVLVVGLGCETLSAEEIGREVGKTGKPVGTIRIQEAGGTRLAVEEGIERATDLLARISGLEREPVPVAQLILGTECGGSDTCSGFSANPAVGYASDLLIAQGGTVVLAETTEFMGAEHLLRRRAVDDEIGKRIVEMVKGVERSAVELGVDLLGANPSPGNIAGGITTIEEKSLGCIYKSGTAPVSAVLAYSERIRDQGLVIMDTPGNDPVSITGVAAGGAQLVVFTTGRGTPAGSPIVPVIKIATNSGLYGRMADNLDINAGTIIDGEESIEQVGRRIFERLVAVASGEQTAAERWGHREFSIGRIAPTF